MSTYGVIEFVAGHALPRYVEHARESCMRKLAEQLVREMNQNEIFTVRLRKVERHVHPSLSPVGFGGTELDYRLDIGQVQYLDVQMVRPMQNAFEVAQWSDEFWRPAVKAIWLSIKGWFARGAY